MSRRDSLFWRLYSEPRESSWRNIVAYGDVASRSYASALDRPFRVEEIDVPEFRTPDAAEDIPAFQTFVRDLPDFGATTFQIATPTLDTASRSPLASLVPTSGGSGKALAWGGLALLAVAAIWAMKRKKRVGMGLEGRAGMDFGPAD